MTAMLKTDPGDLGLGKGRGHSPEVSLIIRCREKAANLRTNIGEIHDWQPRVRRRLHPNNQRRTISGRKPPHGEASEVVCRPEIWLMNARINWR